LLTSINLSDNLAMGYSHFYAEVLRVKQVSQHLANGRRLFVIFDELFRGTNVKDAYDATVAITEAYGRHPHCVSVVSTHIIEAADVLRQRSTGIQYLYLPTIMEGNTPRYTYRLQPGVTADRHGLVIIENEGIPAILAGGAMGTTVPSPAASVFLTDKQTLDDLNLTGKYKPKSIFSLFNETVTDGGERLLEEYFRTPLTDATAINARSAIFHWFSEQLFHFPIDPVLFTGMAHYLRTARAPKPTILFRSLLRRSRFLLGVKEEYLLHQEGLRQTLNSLALLRVFLQEGWVAGAPAVVQEKRDRMMAVLQDSRLGIEKAESFDALSWQQALRYEMLLQGELHAELESVLAFLYELDLYIAVGNAARKKGMTRAMAYPKEKQTLVLNEVWHPALDKAVPNDINLDSNSNLIFLTGANMAGKSTIMKTLGVAFYLGHMGFPVPARQMEFSVMQGVYTSINVPDNLDKGYSHFYAEVMRIKKVAEAVAGGQQLLVIFDELFKGTNVKDAYDATLLVSQALPRYSGCRFVISTHITEVGQALMKDGAGIQFRYMPTVMQGTVPYYPYRMAAGISEDRHGMVLIRKEGVLEMLEGAYNSADL
jgi:DNA mismatch repair ATPase MutS